ncbi:MAG: sodium:calcium antiporter [Geobacter sp.]|nr:sodium:calcium antiporter [Geobacter sp.]
MINWLGFIVCSVTILYSGAKLSKYGDVIAEKTGMGKTWIGVLLMASVTSLPELVTGISAVTYSHTPDIAVGSVMGSCVFNLVILAFLDITEREKTLSAKAHHGHVLSGGFGILLLSLVSISLCWGGRIPPVGWIGWYSLAFIVVYVIAIRIIFAFEKRQIARFISERAEQLKYEGIQLRSAAVNYGWNALLVTIAAIFLPGIGERIAVATGLGETFVGNIFIAMVTSLPEVVVSVTAVKIGAIDLAIGNLLGSNIFNVFILALDDVFYFHDQILSNVHRGHIISAVIAIAMTSIAIIGLTYRSEKKLLFLAWDSLAIMILNVVYLMLMYSLTQ